MHRRTALIHLVAALSAVASPVFAQTPSRPLKLIVPTPAGGPSDTAARTFAQAYAQASGQPVVVENRPGAGGAVAAQALLGATPDGHTLLWGLASMAGLPALSKASPYRSMSELVPVTLVGGFVFALFASPDLPARTVGELVSHLRARPGGLSYATGTLGEYMGAVQFLQATGTDAVRVPYKGGAQLMPDLVAGRVQFNVGPVSSGLGFAKDGKLRMLAVAAPRRTPVAPEVPTLAEAGVASSGPLPTWQALFAPPGTPREIVEPLARAFAAVLTDEATRVRLEQQALQVDAGGPAALAKRVAEDAEAWREFVRRYEIPQE